MATDKRALLRLLRNELEFLEKGGYAEFEKRSWRPAMFFEDSPSCPNHGGDAKHVPCTLCALGQVVPIKAMWEEVPCRHIRLNEYGETLQSLYRTASRHELEWKLNQWLRNTIERLEKEVEQTFPLESDTSVKVSNA
jgi:hypothetical protein